MKLTTKKLLIVAQRPILCHSKPAELQLIFACNQKCLGLLTIKLRHLATQQRHKVVRYRLATVHTNRIGTRKVRCRCKRKCHQRGA